MNKVMVWGAAAFLVLIGKQAQAQHYISACAAALTYTEVASSDNLAVQYAYLSTKLENMRSTSNTGAGVTVPIYGVPVSLSYQDAQTREQQLSEQLGVSWDVKHAQAYTARYVSSDSNSTFGQCVRDVLRANHPVLVEVIGSDVNYVNIKIHIGTQPPAQGISNSSSSRTASSPTAFSGSGRSGAGSRALS